MPTQTMDSNTARLKWRDLIDSAMRYGVDVIITRYGKPVVAVLAYDDFQAVVEELEDLRATRRAAATYEEWKKDPSTGEAWDMVKSELGIKDM